MVRITSPVLFFVVATVTGAVAQEEIDLIEWIREAEGVLAKTDSYKAIFHKHERIRGDLTEEETILFKFKKPFKVYMKWIKDPFCGRESLYVGGWNNNQVKVHTAGLRRRPVTLNLNPKGPFAMRGNRHPITDIGLEHLVKLIGKNLRKGIKAGELDIKEHGEGMVYGHKTQRVEAIFPKDKAKGYYCHRAFVNLDVEKKVPLKVQIYDWDNKLIEDYGYEDLELNAGLTDADFDPKNPEYRFQ